MKRSRLELHQLAKLSLESNRTFRLRIGSLRKRYEHLVTPLHPETSPCHQGRMLLTSSPLCLTGASLSAPLLRNRTIHIGARNVKKYLWPWRLWVILIICVLPGIIGVLLKQGEVSMNSSVLDQALFESLLRYENKLAAIRLGFFGKTTQEIAENSQKYESNLKYKVDSVCNALVASTTKTSA